MIDMSMSLEKDKRTNMFLKTRLLRFCALCLIFIHILILFGQFLDLRGSTSVFSNFLFFQFTSFSVLFSNTCTE